MRKKKEGSRCGQLGRLLLAVSSTARLEALDQRGGRMRGILVRPRAQTRADLSGSPRRDRWPARLPTGSKPPPPSTHGAAGAQWLFDC